MTAVALSRQAGLQGFGSAAEAGLAAVLAGLAYFALQGELPYHDAQRFTDQVGSGSFVWDIGHILLQPSALLLHRGSGATPEVVLKALSSLATAVAVGLFHLLLLRLGVRRWQAVLGTVILAGSCSVLTLAPSAHPKLVAFPFINGALLCLCIAESRDRGSDWGLLALGGVLLALGAAFLASVLTVPPLAAVALLAAARQGGAGWRAAFWRAGLMAGVCGLTFLAIACASYGLLTHEPLSLAGLTGSVTGKAELRPATVPLAVHLARVVFGTVNNLVASPGLGATAQAIMRGQVQSLRPYAGLLPALVLWVLTAMLIATIYCRTAWSLLRGQVLLTPVAFLCGAQIWTIWYGLNDPEHWFQLTAPTIVLFLTLMPTAVLRLALPGWAVIATAANLAVAVPVATYPLDRNAAALATMLGPRDLLVFFGSYPGRAYVGFYPLPGIRTLEPDIRLREPGATASGVLSDMDATVGQTLQDGGRVIVADILDPLAWEAPWMALLGVGVTKPQLYQALLASRTAMRLEDLGAIKLWELRPGLVPAHYPP